jgi:hypothetical protein
MLSTTHVYRATVGLLWALALWHSWTCRGLFVDGSAFMVQIVSRQWFFDFYPPRLFAMVAGQIPIMLAMKLGVTDLHVLAILLSLGLFGLPTMLYQFALSRAKQDPVLLAAVLAAIGVVFMTTSFFIVGEYNSAYAIAILVAVQLATTRKLNWPDALVILAISALAIRTYEAMIYLGPLMASMILWTAWRQSFRPLAPALLSLLSAAFFLLGMVVAFDSVVHPWSVSHLDETYSSAKNFWQNMQFDLAFGAALVVLVWGLVKPAALAGGRPYFWGGICIAILALSPLLALSDTLVRPLAKSQYVARTAGGLVIATMVAFIWAYASGVHGQLKALAVLRAPAASRRLLVFACLIVLANLPSDLFLTQSWVKYLDALHGTVRTHSGILAFEDTPLSRRPHLLLVENWVLPSQSLAVRTRPEDAIIVPPRDFTDWVPFPASDPPKMGRYFWRD